MVMKAYFWISDPDRVLTSSALSLRDFNSVIPDGPRSIQHVCKRHP